MKTSQHAHITYTTLMCDNLLSIHQPLTKMGFLSFAKLMIPAGFLGDAGGTATAGADLFELLLFIPFELLLFELFELLLLLKLPLPLYFSSPTDECLPNEIKINKKLACTCYVTKTYTERASASIMVSEHCADIVLLSAPACAPPCAPALCACAPALCACAMKVASLLPFVLPNISPKVPTSGPIMVAFSGGSEGGGGGDGAFGEKGGGGEVVNIVGGSSGGGGGGVPASWSKESLLLRPPGNWLAEGK